MEGLKQNKFLTYFNDYYLFIILTILLSSVIYVYHYIIYENIVFIKQI